MNTISRKICILTYSQIILNGLPGKQLLIQETIKSSDVKGLRYGRAWISHAVDILHNTTKITAALASNKRWDLFNHYKV